MSDITDPSRLGVLEAARALRARELSAVELLDACDRAIAQRNGGPPTFDGEPGAVNAFVRLYPELAAEQARAADERLAREGDAAPLLCGVPLALKDLYGVAGLPLTASSRVLEGNVAPADCEAWRRLAADGMVLVGHTHTHEFAAGGTTDQVGNPHALDRSAGGSSGGSAAAVAAGMVPAALGTDTAASLRIPAAFTGTCSIKATHGRVPIDGIVPLSQSFDHAGPMARSVADCAAVLAALARGGAQVTPLMPPPAALDDLPLAARGGPRPLAGLRIALTGRPEAAAEIEPDVTEGTERVRDALAALGAEIVFVEDTPADDMAAFSAIMFGEVAEHHDAHVGVRDRYRVAIREFVEVADAFRSAEAYIAAVRAREAKTAEWEAWFASHRVDALLEPTGPVTAPLRGHGYDSGNLGGQTDPLIALTATWNFNGFPVVTLPAGPGARSGLPVGVSLAAPRGREAALVQLGIDLQEHALGGAAPVVVPAAGA